MEDSLKWSFDDGLWTAFAVVEDNMARKFLIEVTEDGMFYASMFASGHEERSCSTLEVAKNCCERWNRDERMYK
jgi:hypothetical protein